MKYLTMKPGAKLYRAVGLRHDTHDILVVGDSQAELQTLNRGFFFEPINSAEKAAELVKVGYPGAVVIKNAGQYEAIVRALKAKGWQAVRHIKVENPPSYGATTSPEPQLGYRVRVLMIDYSNYYDLGLRNVMYREFAVAGDGRMGIIKETVCIVAPETPYGAPPGWTQPLPLGPKEYNEILRSVLTPTGTEAVPAVNVTDKRATIKCTEDEDSTWYVNDYENWPEHANR